MIVLDSSVWIEYLSEGSLASKVSVYFEDLGEIVTPALVFYEVYKKLKIERGEEDALLVAGQLKRTVVQPIDDSLALIAADVSLNYGIPMADSLIYATAQMNNCKVVSLDSDFKNLPLAIYIPSN